LPGVCRSSGSCARCACTTATRSATGWRRRASELQAALASLGDDPSAVAGLVRKEFKLRLAPQGGLSDTVRGTRSAHAGLQRAALQAARRAILAMRADDEIADDAFHVEEELDWLAMTAANDEG
jgi:hypothetical protein